MPLDALAEVERPDAAVLVRLPRLGEAGGDVGLAERAEELEALGDDAVGAEVLHGDRIERAGRLLAGDADRSTRRTASGRCRCLGCAASAFGGPFGRRRVVVIVAAAGREHGSHERNRQAECGTTPQEVTPVDAPLGKRLDEIDLSRRVSALCAIKWLGIHSVRPPPNARGRAFHPACSASCCGGTLPRALAGRNDPKQWKSSIHGTTVTASG